MDYRAFTFYTVLACLRSLGRSALKKRVIDSPDVLSAIGDVPHLAPTLTAFYEGRYRDFLEALTALYPALVRDRYLSRHAPFFLREMRCAAYAQYLESYKSVTLGGMAGALGVGPAFLDAELSRFIACGRLNAKVDAVAGAWGWGVSAAAACAARPFFPHPSASAHRGIANSADGRGDSNPRPRRPPTPATDTHTAPPRLQASSRRPAPTRRTRSTPPSSSRATRCSTRSRSCRAWSPCRAPRARSVPA